ncbi:hypothetical protein [Nocardia brevicatena]|uniref:hypothetical protein n=1 Tax=Nocardia brevicatena TaxID=37327 RepID=UPI0002FE7ABD|nr:hypothetical protein [Nocardia brevicatena]
MGSARTPALRLTHLGESGAGLLELMAKSRHRKVENLRRYFKPSPQAMRDLPTLFVRTPNADAELRRFHIRYFFGDCCNRR